MVVADAVLTRISFRRSWYTKLVLDYDSGKVDCSNVVMSNGKQLILSSIRCYLCGQAGGLKLRCNHDGCNASKKGNEHAYFHVTCARQAGLEVNTVESGRKMHFYGMYGHDVCVHERLYVLRGMLSSH